MYPYRTDCTKAARGRYAPASGYVETLIALARFRVGILLAPVGFQQVLQALEHLSILLQVKPNDEVKSLIAQAALRMGQYFLIIGDHRKAAELFRQAVDLEPRLLETVQELMGYGFSA